MIRAREWRVRITLDQIVIDCHHAAAAAEFWAALLDGESVERAFGWAHVVSPGLPKISFQPVPEAKQVKNRLHLDLEVDDIEGAVELARKLGAQQIGEVVRDTSGSYQVMADPWGTEFCFVCD